MYIYYTAQETSEYKYAPPTYFTVVMTTAYMCNIHEQKSGQIQTYTQTNVNIATNQLVTLLCPQLEKRILNFIRHFIVEM